jgi:hypothetical protein
VGAALLGILRPVQFLAAAAFAEIAGKWPDFEEAQQREELANAILHWRAGEAPFVRRLQGKTRARDAGGALLDHVSKVER